MKAIRYFYASGHQAARHLKRSNLLLLRKGIEKQLSALRVMPLTDAPPDLTSSRVLRVLAAKQ